MCRSQSSRVHATAIVARYSLHAVVPLVRPLRQLLVRGPAGRAVALFGPWTNKAGGGAGALLGGVGAGEVLREQSERWGDGAMGRYVGTCWGAPRVEGWSASKRGFSGSHGSPSYLHEPSADARAMRFSTPCSHTRYSVAPKASLAKGRPWHLQSW